MNLSNTQQGNIAVQEPTVTHSTFVIERSYPVPLERVFAAFEDPARKRRWFFESDGNEIEHFEMDFRVGGQEQARFRFNKPGTPVQGLVCTTDARFQHIIANRRIVLATTMTIGGHCISAALVTFEFLASPAGTALIVTHQGAFFEGADGPKMREAGWQKLLDRLPQEFAS